MCKKITFLLCFLFAYLSSWATYNPVTVTGFTADIVANGTGNASASTTADVDGAGYAFMAADFNPAGTTPTKYLPTGGLVNSAATSGLTFQLASYASNNSLRLAAQNASGTLTLATPTSAGEVFLTGTSGSGASVCDVVVTFTDATTQTFTGISNFGDWYGGTPFTIQGLGRVTISSNTIDNNATDPRLYETKLTLSAANYSKSIASITVTKTNAGGVLQIMGVSINTVCSGIPTAGTAQASSATVCSGGGVLLSLAGSTTGFAALTYQWSASTDNGVTWNPISGATAASYAATNITVATQYRCAVTCNGSATPQTTTSTSVSVAIATAYTPPYLENFESITANNQLPNCMTSSTLGTTVLTYATQPTGTQYNRSNHTPGGSKYAAFRYSCNDYFYTPAINVVAGSTYAFTFWYITDGISGWNTLQASYGSSATPAAQTNILGTMSGPTNQTYQQFRATFVAQTTGTIYFAIYCTANSTPWYLSLDDIGVNLIPPCAAPAAQPTALVLTPAALTVGGTFTAASPAPNNYLVVRSPGTAALSANPANGTIYTAGSTIGNGIVVAASASTSFTDNVTPGNTYRYTVFSYNDTCVGVGPVYLTTNPLTATTTTQSANIYTWNGSVSTDYTVAGNWTPNRTTPAVTDILLFNNGIVDTVKNIPTQTVGRISFTNNTTAIFQSGTTAATLTLGSDNDATTNEFNIAQGSSLLFNGTTTALTLAFSGTGGTGKIAGTLEIANTGTPANAINFTNAIDTVTSTGIFNLGGTTAATVTSTAANLVILGTYNHKYATIAGTIPTATWGVGSNTMIASYTTATAGPGGAAQAFYNFTVNCPNWANNSQWGGTVPTAVNGTLAIISTGTGTLQLSASTAYTMSVNNFTQSGGTVDLGTSTGAKTINVAGTFSQTAGLIKSTGTGSGVVTLNFNGTAGSQNVTFLDSAIVGQIVYQVSNPAGINLNGIGNFTTNNAFKINNGGGVRISTAVANPINTSLVLTYAATGTTLTYDAPGATTTTANVWPATNGPLNVTVNMSGADPANRLTLHTSKTFAAGTFTLTNGVVVLGSNNLVFVPGGSLSVSSPGVAKMIAADGTGQLIRNITTTASTSYSFPVGDVTNGPDYSPVNITFVTNAAVRDIGVRVVDAQHPNDLSTTNYLTRYWVLTDDSVATSNAYTYNGSFSYPLSDVVGTEGNIRLNRWNGTAWSQIPTSFPSGSLTLNGNQSNTTFPLGNGQFTGRPAVAGNTYTWIGNTTGSTDFQVATNWSPARTTLDIADILQFTDGLIDTVKNIPSQTITRLKFSTAGTKAVFIAPSSATLTLLSDGNPATNELDIAQNDTLLLNSTSSAITIAYSGTGATANIAGQFEAACVSSVHTYNAANCITTVTSTGVIAGGGTTGTGTFTNNTVANLIVNGTYNHKYTTGSGPGIPVASWNTGSTVLISGYTTSAGGPNGGMNQVFYNFTYNCPGQSVSANWSGNGPLTVTNNFTMVNTGTGTLQFATTQGYNYVIKNYIHQGGTLDLSAGSATATPILNISGDFNMTGGVLKSSSTTTGANAPIINFNGSGTAQNVSFSNVASPTGQITYRISNPQGINLTTLGGFSTLAINGNGGVRISTAAANPINTTLPLTYAAASTLTYDPPAATTATASVWPATSGPANVTINSADVITIPFSRTISGTLTMTAGDMDISSNTLTIGTAAATPGALSYTAGNIRLTTGSLVRWYGTSSLPTSAGTGVGFYPIAYGSINRNVAFYFSTATALSTGGTIGVGHTNVNGLFTLTPAVGDASVTPTYNINKRTSSSWAFTAANGIAASGTIGVKVTGTGLFNLATPSSAANLRAMQANAIAGTHAAGSGVSAFRTGLAVTDLANPFYIGAADTTIADGYIAIATGNWSTPSTWLNNNVPGITNDATINPGVTVTVDAATNAAKSLTISATGTLMVNSAANTVTIDSVLVNSGTVVALNGTIKVNGNSGASGITNAVGGVVNVLGGTLTLGPTGGGNKPFSNSGQLVVASGTLNINGNYVANAGSSTNQAGGAINVDGNAGGNPANSVAASTPIVNLLSPTLSFSGGTFTVVDPHVASTGTNTFVYNNAATVAAVGSHTFRFGNGTSLDTATNTSYLFSVNPNITTSGKFVFNNVEINSGTGTNRAVVGGGTFGVMGNFVVNNGGEFRINSGITLYLNGNLTVNTGGIFTSTTSATPGNTVYFGNLSTGTVQPSTALQTVSGGGWFRNANTATPNAQFYNITVSNSNMVLFNMTNDSASYSGAVTFVAGAAGPSRIKMPGVSRLIEVGGSVSGAGQTTGWVFGRHQKLAPASSAMNHTFSVGDSLYYTPVNVSTTSAPTVGGAMWAKSTAGDHPQIASSAINASKSINRYYTIQPVNGLTIPTGVATATCNWNVADVDPNINNGNLRGAIYAGTTWNYPTANVPTATSQAVTGLVPLIAGDYQFGEFCAPLNITTQPAATSACIGGPATFTVGLSAGTTGVTYQWQKGGTPITGATNQTYTIPAVAVTDAGNYTVVLSSTCSAATPVTSAVAALTINTPASITTQPTAQTACNGSPATFTVVGAGTGITYQWQKGGLPITGATNASYTIPVVSATDAGNYSVVVIGSAPCGNVTSNTVSLTVNPLPLTIVAAGSTTFCSGGSVVLKASSISGLTYQWKLGGTNITGATDSTYTATAFGNYTAQITNTANSCTNISNTIAVSNGAPASSITPTGAISACTGDSTLLTGPNPGGVSYVWKLNGNPIAGATNFTYKATAAGSYTLDVSTSPACVGTSAATTLSLIPLPTVTVTPATATTFCNGGSVVLNSTATGVTYQWQNSTGNITGATNANYTATTSESYKVLVTSTTTGCKNTSTPPVAVTVNPLPAATITAASATTFCAGGSVVLKTNSATGLTYQWLRGGTPVSGATDSTYTASVAGAYTVTVTRTATTCSATTATATTVTVNPLPNVTVTASNGSTICSGTATNLCVPSASGVTYQWYLNGPAITGATTACYNATLAGSYTVTAINTSTTCSATAAATVITVNPAPVATATALGNTTVCQGDTVWLNANNNAGLTYQWNLNGSPIAGPGTTSISYPATQTGVYSVTTSNGNCTTTSNNISVTVNPKPTATIAYTTPITFCEGGAVVLTGVSNSGTGGGVTYQWNNNASAISGATDNYFVATQTGNYSVQVTNTAGCSANSAQVLVVVNPLPQPVITQSGSLLQTGSFATYQWYFNSQPINGATSQSYNVTQNGAYFVRVTDANGCTNYSSVTFFNNVGVPNVSVVASDIKIYPNPAHQTVNIDAPVKVDVMIRDLQGRVILTQKDVKRIDLGDIASGVYMIMVLDENGQLLKMEKLFKSE